MYICIHMHTLGCQCESACTHFNQWLRLCMSSPICASNVHVPPVRGQISTGCLQYSYAKTIGKMDSSHHACTRASLHFRSCVHCASHVGTMPMLQSPTPRSRACVLAARSRWDERWRNDLPPFWRLSSRRPTSVRGCACAVGGAARLCPCRRRRRIGRGPALLLCRECPMASQTLLRAARGGMWMRPTGQSGLWKPQSQAAVGGSAGGEVSGLRELLVVIKLLTIIRVRMRWLLPHASPGRHPCVRRREGARVPGRARDRALARSSRAHMRCPWGRPARVAWGRGKPALPSRPPHEAPDAYAIRHARARGHAGLRIRCRPNRPRQMA